MTTPVNGFVMGGMHTLAWSGNGPSGARLAAGIYLAERGPHAPLDHAHEPTRSCPSWPRAVRPAPIGTKRRRPSCG